MLSSSSPPFTLSPRFVHDRTGSSATSNSAPCSKTNRSSPTLVRLPPNTHSSSCPCCRPLKLTVCRPPARALHPVFLIRQSSPPSRTTLRSLACSKNHRSSHTGHTLRTGLLSATSLSVFRPARLLRSKADLYPADSPQADHYYEIIIIKDPANPATPKLFSAKMRKRPEVSLRSPFSSAPSPPSLFIAPLTWGVWAGQRENIHQCAMLEAESNPHMARCLADPDLFALVLSLLCLSLNLFYGFLVKLITPNLYTADAVSHHRVRPTIPFFHSCPLTPYDVCIGMIKRQDLDLARHLHRLLHLPHRDVAQPPLEDRSRPLTLPTHRHPLNHPPLPHPTRTATQTSPSISLPQSRPSSPSAPSPPRSRPSRIPSRLCAAPR